MTNRLSVEDVSFSYGRKEVLNRISFTAENGIVALLGNNGAGKTTLMNVLTGLKRPQAGRMTLNGSDVLGANTYPIEQVGYLPQHFDVYPNITGYDFLSFVYDLKKGTRADKKKQIDELVERFHLQSVIHKNVRHYSGGFKRRLGIAQAVLGYPPLIIIDEPTVGLDPEQRIEFRKHLSDMSRESITLISTHIIEDVELFSDQIIVLKDRSIVFDGSVDEIIGMSRSNIHVVETTRERLPELAERVTVIEEKRIDHDTIRVKYIGGEAVEASEFDKEITLENAYVYLQKR